MSDVCVGTSVGTITEPDCLGPCEPGTTVQLEGIVWHETEGGVLVVNITWRGKTYVGTLLDCTRHDWAPPRFCDSPTSDLDSRMPKGRTKRGRAAAHIITNNDFSNFTETRSSVHSKLRNTATKSRRATHGSPANSPSSCAFVSPRIDVTTKRKTKFLEEDDKCKRRLPSQIPSYISPSSSPVLLECPDPNCSKKYKHINGLKYHQSHAHGSTDDDDTKELIISMSENDESNTDAPSPITLVKSPSEKLEDTSTRLTSPTTNISETLLTERAITIHVELPEVINKSPVASEHTVIKPALLRFDNENSKILVESVTSLISPTNSPSENKCSILQENSPLQYDRSHLMVSPTLQHQEENPPFQSEQNKCIKQSNSPIVSVFSIATQSIDHSTQGLNTQTLQDFQQNVLHTSHSSQHLNNPSVGSKIIDQNIINNFPDLKVSNTSIDHTSSSKIISDNPTHLQSFSDINPSTKIPQFKVKPTAALMPEHDRNKELKMCKTSSLKKKYRKSPRSSPQQSLLEATSIDNERDEVQSPAYSDISDDATPIDESNFCDKHLKSNHEKELKSNSENHLTTHFSMYPYFSQSSYLLENIQEKSSHECRINELSSKNDLKSLNIVSIPALSNYQNLNSDKDKKDSITTQINPQQQGHYYTNYNPYMSGFSFQSQTGNSQTMNQLSETEFINQKNKKDEQLISNSKDKHFDNHQVLKESVEMKSQINPYQIYHHSQRPSQISTILPDDRRFYIYTGEQRRKEEIHKQNVVQKSPTQSLKQQIKPDKLQDSNKNDEAKIKQEGVKPTMETQGPPPPPTSQYTYIHPGYIPPHHYGSISYDTGHPGIYRNLTPMIVPSAYANNPYLHQLPRYHTPEDLSRPPSGKALDILQHHANQYYSAHKIHELQERALKSPTPKTAVSSSPSVPPISIRSPNSSSNSTPGTSSSQTQTIRQQSQNSNQQHATCGDSTTSLNKDNRSPPPQRHVHTHHHTHVGLGYPILPGQYPAPYGAAYRGLDGY